MADHFDSALTGLSSAFDSVLSLDGTGEDGIPPECQELLRQAQDLLRSCRSRYTTSRAATRRPAPKPTSPLADDNGLASPPPPPEWYSSPSSPPPNAASPSGPTPPAPPPALPPAPPAAVEPKLSDEEREEREIAARRAQFVLGAGAEDEDLDWSAPAAGGSDDEGEAGSGKEAEAAMAAAAARVLNAVHEGLPAAAAAAAEEEENREPTWPELPDYVPPGTAGFNSFAQAQMRLAGAADSAIRPARTRIACHGRRARAAASPPVSLTMPAAPLPPPPPAGPSLNPIARFLWQPCPRIPHLTLALKD